MNQNIELSDETLRRLTLLAEAQGMDLKTYIEDLLTAKANSAENAFIENPSPSGDEWYADANNVQHVKNAICSARGKCGKEYTLDQIKEALGL